MGGRWDCSIILEAQGHAKGKFKYPGVNLKNLEGVYFPQKHDAPGGIQIYSNIYL